MRTPAGAERVAALRRQHSGVERYLLRMWWQPELPPDDDR